jgi:hypothetical protein
MKATASKRITKHIARIMRSRLSDVLLVSIDGFKDSMMNSTTIATFHYMKMRTNVEARYHNISISHSISFSIHGE